MGAKFVQGSNLFTYSGTNCLRNDYYHNDCRRCIDLCPEGAFHLVRNKLTLFENECIECAACIGGCPTEALALETFDPNAYASQFETAKTPRLSCKQTTPCLGVFDAHHYLVMALRGPSEPECDLTHCEGCNLNREGGVEAFIRAQIDEANRFLDSVGSEASVQCLDLPEASENERRALFKKAIQGAADAIKDSEESHMTRIYQKRVDAAQPLKHLMLKNALKEKLESFTATKIEGGSLFFNKTISFEACTNCGDCIQFCPTKALFATSGKDGVWFSSGKCIGCGICEDICKPNAISADSSIDLVAIAYDRSEALVQYEMVMCHECRCPYPYKGGDPVCDRCRDFKSDFSDMFTLAKDL